MKTALRIYAVCLVICILFTTCLTVSAVEENTVIEGNVDSVGGVEIDITSFTGDGCIEENYCGAEKAVILENGSISYGFTLNQTKTFNLSLGYKVINEDYLDAQIGVYVDDMPAFEGAESVELRRMWISAGEIRTDEYGNQFTPEQVAYDGFTTRELLDKNGILTNPYELNVLEGSHTLTIKLKSGKIAINEIILNEPDNGNKSYEELKREYDANGYKEYEGKVVIVEGENAWLKNSDSMISLSDNSSLILTPASAESSILNYIGSTNWQNSNDEITWKINVPEDGLYKLGTMYKQDQIINGNSYRRLEIDGRVPFAEASSIPFGYCINWEFNEFADETGEPYLFYLTKGEHTLSMSVTLGETGELYSRLNDVCTRLGDLYIDIIMITGETPDKNRDYELYKQIPDFLKILEECQIELDDISKVMQDLVGEKTNSQIAAFNNMSRVLETMVKNWYTAHLYIGDYHSNYTTVTSWLYEMKAMPLNIDQIRLAAPKKEFGEKKVGFLDKLFFGIERFLVSFTNDYRYKKSEADNNNLRIWVNWGNDQTRVLISLIEETFTPKTGIKVNVELVTADLIKGMLSNNQPDLSLHLSRTMPVNLAMRGALYDLSNFSDYKDVLRRFGESAEIPYMYNGGLYALPDQQTFNLMFYRKDILEELNIEVPQTWDEFLAATAVLQRNNMNSSIPYTKIVSSTTTNVGIGGLNLFGSLLMQHGGKFYNDKQTESLLASTTSLSAFKYWTNMYTQYKLPVEADFYNRFRTGTCPLGISIYTLYTTLLDAAPEIQGRWGIALVPGIEQSDGSIKRTVSGAGTGCSILEKSKNKEAAWEFLKWWTSEETQVAYNRNIESLLGTVGRITTANLKAFERMGWQDGDLDIMIKQREEIEEVPELPGSYYLSRSVDQAFYAVINRTSNVKDALSKWGREANEEIARKMAEYQE